MHKFMLGLFGFTRSLIYFIRILCTFSITLLALHWIENLLHADWAWMNFIKPFFGWLLETANSIYSISFDVFGTVFELKYLSAVIILVLLFFALKLLSAGVTVLEGIYKSTHFICKKTEEAIFNKKLQSDMTKEQKKLIKYTVAIKTQVKTKYSYQEANVDLEEQNQLMNKFITENLSVKPMQYQGFYLYNFNNFEKIDRVLDVLFRILRSSAPLNYAICIQVGDNLTQLNKLIELKHFDKITMAADTAYRYGFNENKKYDLSQLGIYQYELGSIEVHEFKEVL